MPQAQGTGSARAVRLLLLREKKPGHFHQVEGVAFALSHRRDVDVDRLDVRPKWFAHDMVRKHIIRKSGKAQAAFWLRFLYGVELESLGSYDLLVASGRPSIAAGILIARATGARLVHSGRVYGYAPEEFALILAPPPARPGDVKVVCTPIPNLIDWKAFPAPRDFSTAEDIRGAHLAFMIGGTAHSHFYADAEWDRLLAWIVEMRQSHGVRWSVSTSRRTPEAVADRLAGLSRDGVIEVYIDYRHAGGGSNNALYGADAVVVTEDSMTMVSEALAARRRVVALRPRRVKASMVEEMMRELEKEETVGILPIADLSPARFASRLLSLRDNRQDGHEIVAEAVLSVLEAD